jgi:hypothetical protein
MVNLVGLVYQYKNICQKKKNAGWINIFALVDPFTAKCIEVTIFDSKKLIYQPGEPVIIFNGLLKSYNGKKQINIKNRTLYYFGKELVYTDKFLDRIYQLKEIKRWCDEGNYVGNIIGNSDKYK